MFRAKHISMPSNPPKVAESNKLNANEGEALAQTFYAKRNLIGYPIPQGCRKQRIRCKRKYGTRPNLSREGATQQLKHSTPNHDAWQRQSRCEAGSLGRGIVKSRPQRGRVVRGGDQADARRTRLPLLRAVSSVPSLGKQRRNKNFA